MGQTPQPPRGITLPKPTEADMQAPRCQGARSQMPHKANGVLTFPWGRKPQDG